MMGQAIQQGRRQFLISENLNPFRKRQIGGYDGGPPRIAVRQQIEPQPGRLRN